MKNAIQHFTETKEGLQHQAEGRYTEAIDCFTKVLSVDPRFFTKSQFAAIYVYRGISKMDIEDKDGAIKDFEVAMEICPEYREVFLKNISC